MELYAILPHEYSHRLPIQYDQISASLLKSYQLLVILRDGMIWADGYVGPDAYTAYRDHRRMNDVDSRHSDDKTYR